MQNVFQILDYFSRWMQEKKKEANAKSGATRGGRSSLEADIERAVGQIERVDRVLNKVIPAEVISRRAVECKSYARALFHWEEYIRQQREATTSYRQNVDLEPLYERLQDIYTQIDEPDGIEGISAHLQVLNIDQQILEHRKAGRWTAAQSWYELLLTENPDDLGIQLDLLTSLKQSGQHGERAAPRTSILLTHGRRIAQPDRRPPAFRGKLCCCFTFRSRSLLGDWQVRRAEELPWRRPGKSFWGLQRRNRISVRSTP